jgi:ABC-type phosphate/phosphonate transport system substrate-binding protein
MKKIAQFLLLSALLALQACKGGQETKTVAESKEPPLRFCYMICDSKQLSSERFAPFSAYLSEKLGRKVEMVLANTFDVEGLAKKNEFDFFHVNSAVAITLKERYKAEFLGVDVQGRNGHKATGTLIARKESGIKTIADIKGKSVIFGPALAPFGYMAQYAMMLENGVDPETDLARYDIPPGALKHDKIMYGVEFGKYDVGAAPRIDLDRMAAADIINLDNYNIIAESEPMPYCTIGAMPHVDAGLREKVKNLLLNLKKDETVLVDGEVLKVLKRMGLDGFHPAIDSEYDIIREKLKRCNMAPYDKH